MSEREKRRRLNQIESEYENCELCPALCASRKSVVMGSGSPLSKVVLVGPAPDASCEVSGLAVAGKERKLLASLLKALKIAPEDVYYTNAVLCKPPGTRSPSRKETKACFTRLSKEIEVIDPLVVVILGNEAAKALSGPSLRGSFYAWATNTTFPYSTAVTKGVRMPVERNAIVTFSLREIINKYSVELKRDTPTYWLYLSIGRAIALSKEYTKILGVQNE